jgi:hypothetical protein
MAIQLVADHVGSQHWEPQRVNNAILHFSDLPGDEDLTLALSSFPLPKVTNGIIEVGYVNEKRKFAGLPTFDDLSVIYKDYVDKNTANILLRWRRLVYDPVTGVIGLKSQYAKDGWVELFAPNGEHSRFFDIIGAWPSGYDPGDIDLAGEDTVNITLTLTIDKARPTQGFNSHGLSWDTRRSSFPLAVPSTTVRFLMVLWASGRWVPTRRHCSSPRERVASNGWRSRSRTA